MFASMGLSAAFMHSYFLVQIRILILMPVNNFMFFGILNIPKVLHSIYISKFRFPISTLTQRNMREFRPTWKDQICINPSNP